MEQNPLRMAPLENRIVLFISQPQHGHHIRSQMWHQLNEARRWNWILCTFQRTWGFMAFSWVDGRWGLNCNSEIIPERTWVNSSDQPNPLIQKWQGKCYLCFVGKNMGPWIIILCSLLSLTWFISNHETVKSLCSKESDGNKTKLRPLHVYPHTAYSTPLIKLRFSLTLVTRGFTWNLLSL